MSANYRDYVLNLLAGKPQELAVPGNYWEIQAASAGGSVKLEFDQSGAVTRYAGQGGPATYRSVRITSSVDQTVTLSLGQVGGLTPYNSRVLVTGQPLSATIVTPSALTSLADVVVPHGASQLLAAADATRLSLTIRIPDSFAGTLRVGDSTVDAAHGAYAEAGDVVTIDGTAAVYAYNSGAADVAVSMTASNHP